MTEIPYDWIEKVETALKDTGQLPVWEETFAFPWEEAARAMNLPGLELSVKSSAWKKESEFLSGMGKDPLVTCIELSPIEQPLFWVFSSENLPFFSSLLLGAEGFSDPRLQEGFYQYVLLDALSQLDKMKIFKDVNLHLMQDAPLPKEGALCLEMTLQFPSKILNGRLICSDSFLSGFKSREPLSKLSLFSSELAKKLEVTLRLEVGSTTLSAEEWKGVGPGDFIILDRCSYDPQMEKGSITMILGNTPLFRARLKEEGIKILDYAYYHEEEGLTELETEEPEEMELEDDSEKTISPESSGQIPLTLVVEVSRLKINLEKLLQLKAGSVLDLSINPDQGVDVTIGGKKVARAELVKLGETLGIKILHVE